MYMADTGLMFSKFGIGANVFLNPDTAMLLSSDFRDALAENAVMQALTANGMRTFYWTPKGEASGELDFVFADDRARVIPLEVKSARNVTAKTLLKFVREARSPSGLSAVRTRFRD